MTIKTLALTQEDDSDVIREGRWCSHRWKGDATTVTIRTLKKMCVVIVYQS
jgi:hypothetical protein